MDDLATRYLQWCRAWGWPPGASAGHEGAQPPSGEGGPGGTIPGTLEHALDAVVEVAAWARLTDAAALDHDLAAQVTAWAATLPDGARARAVARHFLAWIVAPDLVEAAARWVSDPGPDARASMVSAASPLGADDATSADSVQAAGESLGLLLYWCAFNGWTDVRKLGDDTLTTEYSQFLEVEYGPDVAGELSAVAGAFVGWYESRARAFAATLERASVALEALWAETDPGGGSRSTGISSSELRNRHSALRVHVLPWLQARGIRLEDFTADHLAAFIDHVRSLPLRGPRSAVIALVARDLHRAMVPDALQSPLGRVQRRPRAPAAPGPPLTVGTADSIRKLCLALWGSATRAAHGLGLVLDVLAMDLSESEHNLGLHRPVRTATDIVTDLLDDSLLGALLMGRTEIDRPVRTMPEIITLLGYPPNAHISTASLGIWASTVPVMRAGGLVDAYYLADAERTAWQAMRMSIPPRTKDPAEELLAAATIVANAFSPSAPATGQPAMIRLLAGRSEPPTVSEMAAALPSLSPGPEATPGTTEANVHRILEALLRRGVVRPTGSYTSLWSLAPGVASSSGRLRLQRQSPGSAEPFTLNADEIEAYRNHLFHVDVRSRAGRMSMPGAVEALMLLSGDTRGQETPWMDAGAVKQVIWSFADDAEWTYALMHDGGLITESGGRVRIGSPAVAESIVALRALVRERMEGPVPGAATRPSVGGPDVRAQDRGVE